MRHNFTLIIAALVLTASALFVVGQTPAPGVAAIVNGTAISDAEVDRATKLTEGWAELPANEQAEWRRGTLDTLIDHMLVDQYLVAQKVSVDDKEIQAEFKQVEDDLKKRNLDYATMLQKYGMTDEVFKKHLVAEVRWKKYRDSKLPDKELRAFFEANKVMFDGTQVKARHILLTPNAKDAKDVEKAKAALAAVKVQVATHAETMLTKLPPDADKLTKDQARGAASEDAFSRAAEANSVCPTKGIGGDLGWFPRICRYDDKVVQTAFNLKPYEVSDIVPTEFGLHLIMMTGRRDGQAVQFEKAREFVRDYCESKMRVALVAELRSTAKIQITPKN